MSNVEKYYDGAAELEWARLDRDRVEFAVTLRALRDHLPPPPAAVLDVGGGPGRYAIELARCGYDVTLADISERELELASQKAAETGCRSLEPSAPTPAISGASRTGASTPCC
jgi:S-adenosylmethionine-dependent methyltransferase